jgi:2,3-bisphosphoglycerate-independent phosphoglycerate mutase
MLDEQGKPHTAHTSNPVPLVLTDTNYALIEEGGELCDLAPTALSLLGLTPPLQMTGKNLTSDPR